MPKTLAILTGGGDCPGLNAVIRGVVRAAILKHGWRVIGIEDGFDGLVEGPKWRELDLRAVLPTISLPTLVVHRSENAYYRVGFGRYLARSIPGARGVEAQGMASR